MSPYAEGTTVSVERSKAEIETTVKRYGADQFSSGWHEAGGEIVFRRKGIYVRLFVPVPPVADFKFDRNRRLRTERQRENAREAEERRRWRALCLVIKAKLEAVESQISTFEREFLADVVLPNGETVAGWVVPQIEAVYKSGAMPRSIAGLLPAPVDATFTEGGADDD